MRRRGAATRRKLGGSCARPASNSPRSGAAGGTQASAVVLGLRRIRAAVTAIIPFPRLGGEKERDLAKIYGENKVSLDAIIKVEKTLKRLEEGVENLEKRTVEGHAFALHEIRKLNRTIKQSSERICLEQSPHDPSKADPQLVAIWKSSEIMSLQFDVIEMLANQSLATLPLNSVGQVYRIFDKCARIYNAASPWDRIKLISPYGFNLNIRVCDKTFSIIPTALLENALKYSTPESEINIEFYTNKKMCCVEVKNLARLNGPLTDDVFKKGVRLGTDKEGSGNGLFLAKLVATQHGAKLNVSSRSIREDITECVFRLTIPAMELA
jgi:light-regulated signal transduction histidine kinase (bacteriophytochrome)